MLKFQGVIKTRSPYKVGNWLTSQLKNHSLHFMKWSLKSFDNKSKLYVEVL